MFCMDPRSLGEKTKLNKMKNPPPEKNSSPFLFFLSLQ